MTSKERLLTDKEKLGEEYYRVSQEIIKNSGSPDIVEKLEIEQRKIFEKLQIVHEEIYKHGLSEEK